MVKPLSKEDNKVIADAIAEAERNTSAEIVVVVAPASDPYQEYVLLYGFAFGSLSGLILSAFNIIRDFPTLLTVELLAISLLLITPFLRRLCIKLIARDVLQQRAARRAYEEYLMIAQRVPAQFPIVLLYISLSEHYAHIITSRMVRAKVPEHAWRGIVSHLTESVKTEGVASSCKTAIKEITGVIAGPFPERGEKHTLSDEVIVV